MSLTRVLCLCAALATAAFTGGCTSPPVPAPGGNGAPAGPTLTVEDYLDLGDAALRRGDRDRARELYEQAAASQTDPRQRYRIYARIVELGAPGEGSPVVAWTPSPVVAWTPGAPEVPEIPEVPEVPEVQWVSEVPDVQDVAVGDAPAAPAPARGAPPPDAPDAAPAQAPAAVETPEARLAQDAAAMAQGKFADIILGRIGRAEAAAGPALRSEHLVRAYEVFSSHGSELDATALPAVRSSLLQALQAASAQGVPGTTVPLVRLYLANDAQGAAEAAAQAALAGPEAQVQADGVNAMVEIWQKDKTLAVRRQAWEQALADGSLNAREAGFLVETYRRLDPAAPQRVEALRLRLRWYPSDFPALHELSQALLEAGDPGAAVAACKQALHALDEVPARTRVARRVAEVWAAAGPGTLQKELDALLEPGKEGDMDIDDMALIEAVLRGPMAQANQADAIHAVLTQTEEITATSVQERTRRDSVLLDGYLSAGKRADAERLCEQIRVQRYPWALRQKAERAVEMMKDE